MIYMTYTNVENCIKRDIIIYQVKYGIDQKRKLNNNNKITRQFLVTIISVNENIIVVNFQLPFDIFLCLHHCYVHKPIQTCKNTCT